MASFSGPLTVRPTRSSTMPGGRLEGGGLSVAAASRVGYGVLQDGRLSLCRDEAAPALTTLPVSAYNAVRLRTEAPWEVELSRTAPSELSTSGSSWKLSGLLRRKGSNHAFAQADDPPPPLAPSGLTDKLRLRSKHKPLSSSSSSRSIVNFASADKALPARPSTATAATRRPTDVAPLILVLESRSYQTSWGEVLCAAIATSAVPPRSSMSSSNSLPSLRLPSLAETQIADKARKPSPLVRASLWPNDLHDALPSPSITVGSEPIRPTSHDHPRTTGVPQWIKDVRSASLDAPSASVALRPRSSFNSLTLSPDGSPSSAATVISLPAYVFSTPPAPLTVEEDGSKRERPSRSRKLSLGRVLRSSPSVSSVASSMTSDGGPTTSSSASSSCAPDPPTPLLQPIELDQADAGNVKGLSSAPRYGTTSSVSSKSSTRSMRETAALPVGGARRLQEHIVSPVELITLMRANRSDDGRDDAGPPTPGSSPFAWSSPTSIPSSATSSTVSGSSSRFSGKSPNLGGPMTPSAQTTSPHERRKTISSASASPGSFLPAYRPRAAPLPRSPSGSIPPPLPSPLAHIRRSSTAVDLDAFGGSAPPSVAVKRLSRVNSCGSEGLDDSEWERGRRESECTVRGVST